MGDGMTFEFEHPGPAASDMLEDNGTSPMDLLRSDQAQAARRWLCRLNVAPVQTMLLSPVSHFVPAEARPERLAYVVRSRWSRGLVTLLLVRHRGRQRVFANDSDARAWLRGVARTPGQVIATTQKTIGLDAIALV